MKRSVALALMLVGCDKPAPPQPCTPDLPSIQATIFQPRCVSSGCHAPNDSAGKLALGVSLDAKELIGVRSSVCPDKILVVPGAPDRSFLYDKVASSPPSCGLHMPLGEQLADSQKACIRAWIEALPR
jgi:hypothetical protein